MAYSTRRKSVNLSLLGIHIPKTSSHAHKSPATNPIPDDSSAPPAKKIKRSHSDADASSDLPRFAIPAAPTQPTAALTTAVPTPPPSPPASTLPTTTHDSCEQQSSVEYKKVDTQGINDDVVVATIEVLEATGNKPHLLKELAVAIAGHVQVVETSANQSAIISSRLTNFLKRPWTALAPCPMGKALVGTHPKRLYFFLTTQPRQEIPDPDDPANKPPKQSRIVTPSLTSGPSEDEDVPVRRQRSEMSPSPELDLTAPDIAPDHDHLSRSTSYSTLDGSPVSGYSHSQTTPALEKDEHEFTQTACLLQRRAQQKALSTTADTSALESVPLYEYDDGQSRHRDPLTAIFRHVEGGLAPPKTMDLLSSPVVYPHTTSSLSAKVHISPLSFNPEIATDHNQMWAELLNPAIVELDELDDLFASY